MRKNTFAFIAVSRTARAFTARQEREDIRADDTRKVARLLTKTSFVPRGLSCAPGS